MIAPDVLVVGEAPWLKHVQPVRDMLGNRDCEPYTTEVRDYG